MHITDMGIANQIKNAHIPDAGFTSFLFFQMCFRQNTVRTIVVIAPSMNMGAKKDGNEKVGLTELKVDISYSTLAQSMFAVTKPTVNSVLLIICKFIFNIL